MKPFLEALDERVLVCDGAMGTMLYAKGVFINRCFDALNLTDADRVAEVHQDYIRAGADVIETNTFGANRIKLRGFGLADRLREINVEGARLAQERRARPGVRRRRDRAARDPHRAVGQDGEGRGRVVLPRAGTGAARGRRRPVHPRDVPRPQRGERRDCRRPQHLRPADRRADDDRGRRQQPRRHAAGAVRAGARAAGRRRHRRELQHRPGADARDGRAHRRRSRTRGSPRSPTPAVRATSRGATSISRRPSTWRRTRGGSSRSGVRLVGGCCGTTPEHIRQIKAAVTRAGGDRAAAARAAARRRGAQVERGASRASRRCR